MKRGAGPEFYDARLAVPGTPLLADAEGGPYAALIAAALELVDPTADVVELGCGTGRFARELIARGVGSYVGIDFAPGHIAEARRYVPDAEFRLADLRTALIPRADVYVALEVLEHLEDDLGLLAELPFGSDVVLSVPSFDSASHVRTFPVRGDAVERYCGLLAIDEIRYIDHRRGHFFHLLRGRRR